MAYLWTLSWLMAAIAFAIAWRGRLAISARQRLLQVSLLTAAVAACGSAAGALLGALRMLAAAEGDSADETQRGALFDRALADTTVSAIVAVGGVLVAVSAHVVSKALAIETGASKRRGE